MKNIYCIILFIVFSLLINSSSKAQYNGMQNIGLGLQSILTTNYASTAPQSYGYGNASEINAYGNFLVNQSIANMNNETAYSMSLSNQIQRTQTFFEKRQINRYYRDMEAWQYSERNRLKRLGIYDKEAIENLYNIRTP